MRGQLYHGHYLSHYVWKGEGEANAQARLRALLGYPISVRQETPSDDDKVRILERRAAV